MKSVMFKTGARSHATSSAIIYSLIAILLIPMGVLPQSTQRLVENVDIQGNRRNRDEDITYYIQTKPGDVYNPQQVERDLQSILSLGFFDKTETKVLTQDGPRGGVEVIFVVKELPVIRDIQFKGLKSVPESDVLKAFRENRVGVSKEAIYDPVKARNAVRLIKELLASRGHPNARIEIKEDEVSQTSTAITFDIDEAERVRVADIQFEGNSIFKDDQLRSQMKYVKESGLISRFQGKDILDRQKLEYDLRLGRQFMASKGYLQARTGEPRIEGLGKKTTGFFIPLPMLSSKDETLRITVPIIEGKLYKVGDIKVEGNSIFSEQVVTAVIGLRKGDIANGERISKALYENLKKLYGTQGFIQYTAEPSPTFKDNPQNPNEGIVDFLVSIEEGKQFSLRRLEFVGNTFTRDNVMRREFLLNEGDVYDQTRFEYSILRLNQLGYFDPIDKEKDADFRTNEEEGQVDVNVKVAERGRQQISFNGGVSGIGGSFFGLEYSTNNLFGRGESLSFNMAAGNRQKSFVFSFTEPYIKNRPITAGFSIFTQSMKFFGPGTYLSQNPEAVAGLYSGLFGYSEVGEENLFTQVSNGGSVYVSSPLSEFYRKRKFTQFSRIGLSYSISQTSVKDPEVNRSNDPTTFIPVIYRQPKILTSRITPSFVYDDRNASIDPTQGKQLSLSLGFAGLGGDVRTYQPSLSYTHYIPMRRKRSDRPEVFGFRLMAGHIGSFSVTEKIRNTASLAFVNGIPIYERYFLGDEFTIRGYNVRSISPISQVDNYVATQGQATAIDPNTGNSITLSPTAINQATFRGSSDAVGDAATGVLRSQLYSTFAFIGGDTQLLGNFEYRIPIFGPVSLAAFLDIGTVFNLKSGGTQSYSTEFQADPPYLSATTGWSVVDGQLVPVSLTSLTARANSLGLFNGNLVVNSSGEFLTSAQLDAAVGSGTTLPPGLTAVFLRGQTATNTVVRLSNSQFSRYTDYRSSMGLELRVQVPVVNVPFRLIYAYNPNARSGQDGPLSQSFFFDEKKSVFRFSIGRTF
jgi:outer membrane protein insertion porin family